MTALTCPHKSGGSPDRKAPPGGHYPVYIGAYTDVQYRVNLTKGGNDCIHELRGLRVGKPAMRD
jgi:hypothetical protein